MVSLYHIVISASIFLVDIGSQVASAHWYFLERFLELSELSFFLKVQGQDFGRFRVSFIF